VGTVAEGRRRTHYSEGTPRARAGAAIAVAVGVAAVAALLGGCASATAPAESSPSPSPRFSAPPFVSSEQARQLVAVTAAALQSDVAGTMAAIDAGEPPFVLAGGQLSAYILDTAVTLAASPDAAVRGQRLQGARDALGRPFRDQTVAGALARGQGSLEYAFRVPDGSLHLRTIYYSLVTGGDGARYVVCAERYVAPIAPTGADAAQEPTPADVRALVERAVAYARLQGKERALAAFNAMDSGLGGDGLAVVAFDTNGVVLADGEDPSLVGTDLSGMHDAAGQAVMTRLVRLAQEGSGWLYCGWPNPAKLGREEDRVLYVLKVDDEWFIASGASGRAAVPPPGRDEVKAFVDEALAYVREVGRRQAFAAFMDEEGAFVRGQLYVFADAFDGVNLCFPAEPQTVGTSLWDRRDADGIYPVRAMAAVARERGSGWVSYAYVNPAHGYQVQRKLSYVRRAGDDWFIGAGTYELPD
jgi:hypothetical protein